MKKFFKKKNKTSSAQGYSASKKGFALLFTVLVISIILAIGLGISDVTYKQTILSSLARNSQLAFYQADSGVECGMYFDVQGGIFPRGTTAADAASKDPTIYCGDNTLTFTPASSHDDYFVYTEQTPNGTDPCYSVTFDKTDPVHNSVSSRGLSTCINTAQQVERALNVTY
jgi:hypothetical protein